MQSKYVVTYREQTTDNAKRAEFASGRGAIRFARDFVANAYRNESGAAVWRTDLADPLRVYVNEHGRARLIRDGF